MSMKVKSIDADALKYLNDLPDIARVRPKVAALLLGVSLATFWRIIARSEIRVMKITPRTTSVSMADLRAYITSKVGG